MIYEVKQVKITDIFEKLNFQINIFQKNVNGKMPIRNTEIVDLKTHYRLINSQETSLNLKIPSNVYSTGSCFYSSGDEEDNQKKRDKKLHTQLHTQ